MLSDEIHDKVSDKVRDTGVCMNLSFAPPKLSDTHTKKVVIGR